MTFEDLNLTKPLLNALEDLELTTPTTIQEKVFSVMMSGQDVCGIAQTGTGKTLPAAMEVFKGSASADSGHRTNAGAGGASGGSRAATHYIHEYGGGGRVWRCEYEIANSGGAGRLRCGGGYAADEQRRRWVDWISRSRRSS